MSEAKPKKRQPYRASNSFRVAEVRAMNQMFDILARGGDPSVMMRSNEVRMVRAKFRRMLDHIERVRPDEEPA